MSPDHGQKRTLVRYTLFQIPELLGIILLILVIRHYLDVADWIWGLFILIWIVKDVILYPFVRSAYDTTPIPAEQKLVGLTAEVVQPLTPEGIVRVRGELWRARLSEDSRSADRGESILITAVEGLKLIVEIPREPDPIESLDSSLIDD